MSSFWSNGCLINSNLIFYRKTALEGLVSISKVTSKPIEEITLPLLFGKLPDTAPALDDETKRLEYKQILSSVSVLCTLPGLLEMMIVRILSRLETLAAAQEDAATGKQSETSDDSSVRRECNAAYAYSLLRSLLSTIRSKVQDGHRDVAKHFDTLVPRLFDTFVRGAATGASDSITTDVRLLSAAASIIETMTQTLAKEYVQHKHLTAIRTNQLKCLPLTAVRSPLRTSCCKPTNMETSPDCYQAVPSRAVLRSTRSA